MLPDFISFDGSTDQCLSLSKRLSVSSGSCFFLYFLHIPTNRHFRHHRHEYLQLFLFYVSFFFFQNFNRLTDAVG